MIQIIEHKMKLISGCFIAVVFFQFLANSVVAQVDEGYWPTGHTTTISESWPPTGDQPPAHSHYWSLQFENGPANHLYTHSRTWWDNPDGPAVGDPNTPNPPTNHSLPISNRQHGWPPNHAFSQSRWWNVPASHYPDLSRQWTGGHVANVSRSWPGPGTHDLTATRLWPPNHNSARSSTHVVGNPDDHVSSISSGLTVAPSHNQTTSNYWPPNHYRVSSNTWSPTHLRITSATWDGGHVGALSGTWPSGGGVYWPPNHVVSTSNEWGVPAVPEWPPYPPDHSWFTTATGIAGGIPSFPAMPFGN